MSGETREATAVLVDDKMHFTCSTRGRDNIDIDYPPPHGTDNGYTSLEVFLMSLASCSGSSVSLLLKKMGKNVAGLKVHASGQRREQHPTCFEKINLSFTISSDNADDASVKKALSISEETICPVWAMIKNNVIITTDFTITQKELQNTGV